MIPLPELHREAFGAESFERPALIARPDGGWRLFLSCATPDSKHWWIEAIDADTVEALPDGKRTVVMTQPDAGLKDPVVVRGTDDEGELWQMWVCGHPLADPGHEDRMTTAHATSRDGLTWSRPTTVLVPTPQTWDARGTRLTTLISEDPMIALYDGRASAADNWHEVTGIARGDGGFFRADPDGPAVRSPHSDGALRYAAAVPLPDGRVRFYFELARPDGAHDLVTSIS